MDKQIILICFNMCFNRIRFKSYENMLPIQETRGSVKLMTKKRHLTGVWEDD